MQKLEFPLAVSVKLTNKCNYRCIHCIANSGNPGLIEMDTTTVFKLIDELDINNVFSVDFTGGECLLRSDFPSILEYSSNKRFLICVSTNGSLIDQKCAKMFLQYNVSLVKVSLDSANPLIHNKIRGTNDAFDKTINGIKNLVKIGIPVTIQTALSKINIGEIEDIVNLCIDLDVKNINFFIVVPGGRAKYIREYILTPIEYRKVLDKIWNLKNKYSTVNFVTDSPLNFVYETINGIRDKSKNECMCLAGRTGVFIKEDGSVIPCPYFDVSLGNINSSSLKDIWINSNLINALNDKKFLAEDCRECDYSLECFGGCRAAAYYVFGNISNKDPFCWLR